MTYSKKSSQMGTVFAVVLAVFGFSRTVQAEGSAVPGRSVGHVFLGMDRADVWKILGRPGHTATVLHRMSLYGDDDWSNGKYTLTVISERDKVVQVEFDSPRITTTDGLSTKSTLAQIRRRYPFMLVYVYNLIYRPVDGYTNGADGYYLDDMHRGIAFTIATQEAVVPEYLKGSPTTIIVHRPGYRAVPICNGHWSAPEAASGDASSLSLLRSWFMPRLTDTQTPRSPLPVADFEQAPHRILPGQGVDGVSLGTSRADVWKQMGRPYSTEVVPHGIHSYKADLWVHDSTTVTITCEQDKVVQVGFDNINYMANDGRLVFLSLADVRSHHSVISVTCYDLMVQGSTVHQYYMDNVRQGIAYLYSKIGDINAGDLDCCVDKILVHPPGVPALPIYNKHWTAVEPPTEDPNGLRLMRSWFTQKGTEK